MRAVAYPPGVADVVAYSPTVSVYRTVLAAWADEVAALEQERDEWQRIAEGADIEWLRRYGTGTIEREPDGTVVVYGNPKPEHNCDEMGCPSTRHVLLVLPGALTEGENE
jgi:hypothetical protein